MKTIFKVMFLLCSIGLVPSMANAQEKVIIDDEASNGIVMVTIDKAGDEIVRIMNEYSSGTSTIHRHPASC